MKTLFKELSTGDRFRAVADAIEASYSTDTPHDQNIFIHDCGTPSCVAGYAVDLHEGYSVQSDECEPYNQDLTWEPALDGEALDWVTAGMYALGIGSQPFVGTSIQGQFVQLFSVAAVVTPYILRQLADEADAGACWVAK